MLHRTSYSGFLICKSFSRVYTCEWNCCVWEYPLLNFATCFLIAFQVTVAMCTSASKLWVSPLFHIPTNAWKLRGYFPFVCSVDANGILLIFQCTYTDYDCEKHLFMCSFVIHVFCLVNCLLITIVFSLYLNVIKFSFMYIPSYITFKIEFLLYSFPFLKPGKWLFCCFKTLFILLNFLHKVTLCV